MPDDSRPAETIDAEILAIGSELTTGAKLDTNSQWLSEQLAAIGIPVMRHVTVADDLHAMVDALHAACSRAGVVLITGGLGPTLDDLTRQALAVMLGVELELHEPSLEHIRGLFTRRGRTMPERNVIQAMFPQGSRPLPNATGTAPGIYAEIPHRDLPGFARVAAMPGVPSEMKRMYVEQVLPLLPIGGRVIRSARINCFGVGESHAEELLGDVTARGRDPEVGITVHEATITLRITACGDSIETCESRIAETRRIVRERMGELVFGEDDDELEHVLVRLLAERKMTLSSAESGTGGLLAHRLTDVPGFEKCYLGGVVVPTLAAKTALLGVAPEVVRLHGAVSRETARAMAEGCRRRFKTDFALAVTECAESGEVEPGDASPASYIALSAAESCRTVELQRLGDVSIQKSRTTKAALNMLRLHLLRGM